MQAVHRAGAGVIGEYDSCAFQAPGTGRFRGSDASNPTIGTAGSRNVTGAPSASWLAPSGQATAQLQKILRNTSVSTVSWSLQGSWRRWRSFAWSWWCRRRGWTPWSPLCGCAGIAPHPLIRNSGTRLVWPTCILLQERHAPCRMTSALT